MKKFEIEKALGENEKIIKERKDHIQTKLDSYQQREIENRQKKEKEMEMRWKREAMKQQEIELHLRNQ